MKVSVITVCWNSGGTIAAAMESVLAQRGVEVEYIVVDGGSKDGTVEKIKEYEGKFGGRMRWTSERDEGMYDAINKGIAMASGDIVGILNADDMLEGPDTLRRIAEAFEQTKPGESLAGGDTTMGPLQAELRLAERSTHESLAPNCLASAKSPAGPTCFSSAISSAKQTPPSAAQDVNNAAGQTPDGGIQAEAAGSSAQAHILPQAPASKDCARPEEGLSADQVVIDAAGQTPDGGIQAGAAGSSAQAHILPQAPARTLRAGTGEGESPRVEAVYADVRFVKADLATTVRYYSAKHWRPWMHNFGYMPPHPSVYIRREVFARLGGYKLGYQISADFELMVRYLCRNRVKARYLDESVVKMRLGGKSTKNWRANVLLNVENVRANRENGYWCCMAMMVPKYLFKVWGFVFRR